MTSLNPSVTPSRKMASARQGARLIVSLALLAGLGSCTAKEEQGPYKTTLAMQEVMAHVVQPAADGFWSASGEITDDSGTRSLTPTTDAGWLVAENGAAAIMEAANVLMLPSRRVDDEAWIDHAQQLHEAGRHALAAADARDPARMLVVGGEIYDICTSCHEIYQPAPPAPPAT